MFVSLCNIKYLLHADLQKKVETRQTLDAQLSENKLVNEELELVKPNTRVYKLIGKSSGKAV